MTEVITGEAVVIDVPFARFPSRTLALLIDIDPPAGAAVRAGRRGAGRRGRRRPRRGGGRGDLADRLGGDHRRLPDRFETLSRGRSLGKLALGLRVVSDDGGPERFRQALMRALAGVWRSG